MRTVFSTDKEWMTVGKDGVKKQGLGLIMQMENNHYIIGKFQDM